MAQGLCSGSLQPWALACILQHKEKMSVGQTVLPRMSITVKK